MLRVACVILVLALQACAGTPEADFPNAATFRRVNAIEFYDFRLNASHAAVTPAGTPALWAGIALMPVGRSQKIACRNP
jgi:hypothetical protein